MPEDEFLSVTEWAAKYGKDGSAVRRLIYAGRIPGAKKIGSQWVIPASSEPPADMRVKSGKYRNWRKPKDQGD